MTLSLAAVFIPVLFLGGIVGRLFREFAVTIGVAVLISGFVSLSLTPMLASRFLHPGGGRRRPLNDALEGLFVRLLGAYRTSLRWSLRHRGTLLAVTVGSMLLSVVLFWVVPKGFVPTQDIDQLFGQTEAAEGTSFEAMVRLQRAVADVLAADPNVEAYNHVAGGGGGVAASNTGFLFIRLKPRAARSRSADEVVASLRPQFARIPGVRVYLQSPAAIQVGGRMTRSLYQLTLQGSDTQALYRSAPELEARLRELTLLADVSTDLLLKSPQAQLAIRRDEAAAMGISAEQIEDALYSAYGPRQVSTIFAPTNQYRVLMELMPEFQRDPADVSLLYVRSASGRLVPLDSLVRLTPGVGPFSVNHSGQVPSVTLSFNLAPGVSLGAAMAEVERLARATLPATLSFSFQGTAQVFRSSLQGLGLLLAVSILVIYMVLGILYESFIHPLTILSALPLAGLGALATLMLFRTDLDIYAFVGIIMLVGLVKKNGIIMIDFALEAQRRGGRTAADAIEEACLVRFRPIMMTTMAALFGTLPIAVGLGAGGESRRPLGLAVVGGLLVSQSLTLFVTPVIYTYLDSFQKRLGRWLWFPGGTRDEGRSQAA
jgi:HAE1 family hydrophobic/amphiphilic exporter-1